MAEQATALWAAALGLTEEGGQVRPSAFTTRCTEAGAGLRLSEANPNPMFNAMMAVNQLRELGLRPESDAADAPWSRPALQNPVA
ncbi:hypothetical protein ACIGFK_04230 [Streptomyces sp. NPDC085524]|uniref:hypothetical protein n=1 Tax=unclassified Streptomyces TaxID=2593676 RepID=UPI0035DBA5B6